MGTYYVIICVAFKVVATTFPIFGGLFQYIDKTLWILMDRLDF